MNGLLTNLADNRGGEGFGLWRGAGKAVAGRRGVHSEPVIGAQAYKWAGRIAWLFQAEHGLSQAWMIETSTATESLISGSDSKQFPQTDPTHKNKGKSIQEKL